MEQLNLFDVISDIDSWEEFLPENLIALKNIKQSSLDIIRRNCNYEIYPEPENVFKIFKDLKPKDIKVVLLGQDPYYNGNAMGYAFGCKNEISPSLQILSDIIENDTAKPVKEITLAHWVQQGVFLLNTSLTVIKGQPNSHKNIWADFTIAVIKEISKLDNVVWILLGSEAQYYKKFIRNKNLVVEDKHPAFYARTKSFPKESVFKKCNNLLLTQKQNPIVWQNM